MNAGSECESDEVRELRAAVADLCKRIARLECDRPTSGRPDCKEPWLDPPTAFKLGCVYVLILFMLLH